MGGECSYWACMPSKALLRPVEVLESASHLGGVAALAGQGHIDVAAVLARRDDFTSHHDDKYQVQWAEGVGVSVLRGTGRLSGPRSVRLSTPDGQDYQLQARHAVVLATGTHALVPPIEGLAEALPWTSRDVTNLHQVPERVVVVGGGVVACESATWLHGLGVGQLTVVELGPRLLAGQEPFAGEIVAAALVARGVDVRLGTKVARAARRHPVATGEGKVHGGEVTLHLADGTQLRADEVVVAVGRVPNSHDLGLETVGVRPNQHGFIDVDEHATVPGTDWLYVVGDLCGKALLTHMGKYQARVAGDVIATRAAGRPIDGLSVRDLSSAEAVPQVIFTDPEVGSVGLSAERARQGGHDVETVEYDLAQVAGAELLRDEYKGRAQLVIDASDDTVLGATFVGAGVAELVHSATVAVVGQVPLSRLWHAVPSYPTVSEIWLRLLETLRQQRGRPL